MKTIKIVFAFWIVCACYNLSTAQSSKNLDQEIFMVSFTMGPNNQLTQVSFRTSKGKALRSTILDSQALADLNLPPGTSVLGAFRFNGLSGTDLGSGRVYAGSGTLAFDKVMRPDGQKAGCSPLCNSYVRLGVRLQE